MKKLNKNEIVLRIMSIVLGIFLWYIVLNSSNPIETKIINIPLEIRNENIPEINSLGLVNEISVESITVTLRGRKNNLDDLNELNVNAYADYIRLTKSGNNTLKINVASVNEKISIVSYVPTTFAVELEEITEKSFSVEIIPIGEPLDGYKLISMRANPEQISVKGFKSEIDSIESVRVYIEITNADKDKSFTKYIVFYNDKGEEIQDFSREFTTEINASIGKRVTLKTIIIGSTAEGYYLDSYSAHTDTIYITGPYDFVSKISEVRTKPIDISGLKENTTFEIDPNVAGNIYVISVDGELKVDVYISEYKDKTFIFRKNDFLLSEANHIKNIYEVVTDSVEVTIKGTDDILESLLKSDINILVDVSGRHAGIYNLPLTFEFSKDIEIIGDYYATIRITLRPVEVIDPTTIIDQ